MKCDELEIKYVGYGMGFYPTEDVDAAIEELKHEIEKTKTTAQYGSCLGAKRFKSYENHSTPKVQAVLGDGEIVSLENRRIYLQGRKEQFLSEMAQALARHCREIQGGVR